MKRAWWKENVVYQVYPRSFCDSNGDGIGDLNGIRSKLDYLKDLGIHIVWLSPVYQSPNDDNGYDISDYQAIMKEFGTMEDFDLLLAEAHERDIRIVMDLVVNHTSDEHKWFIESRSSRDNEKRDYYIWREAKDNKEPNNWGSCFSGSAWEWDEQTEMYYLHCFSRKQPDLNWENPKVRDEVFTMMDWWCRKGIDGFRMDVISMISKPEGLPDVPTNGTLYGSCGAACCNGPRVHEYLQEMNERVLSHYDLMTVGECAGVTVEEAKKYANADGSELSMVFQFEHVEMDGNGIDKWAKDRYNLKDLKNNLTKWQNDLEGKAWNSLFFCNHDQPRIVSRLGDNSPKSAKCIATFLHMMKGTPYIYQGEELGMTNYPFRDVLEFRDIESINVYKELTEAGLRDPEELFSCIAYKSRDNARTPMQWTDEPGAGFTTGSPWIAINPNYTRINAKAEVDDPGSVYNYYKKLISLRQNSRWSDLIVYGTYALLDTQDCVFAYTRTLENQQLLVLCNFSDHEESVSVPKEFCSRRAQFLIGTQAQSVPTEVMTLSPWGSCIFVLTD